MTYKTTKLSIAARARARERLLKRNRSLHVSALAVGSAAAADSIARVADQLTEVIGVDASYLRRDETLRDALRVHRSELPSELQDLFPALGLRDVIDPFAFAILDLVEAEFRRDPTKLQRSPFIPAPKNEDEWVSRLLDMTVADFLGALA